LSNWVLSILARFETCWTYLQSDALWLTTRPHFLVACISITSFGCAQNSIIMNICDRKKSDQNSVKQNNILQEGCEDGPFHINTGSCNGCIGQTNVNERAIGRITECQQQRKGQNGRRRRCGFSPPTENDKNHAPNGDTTIAGWDNETPTATGIPCHTTFIVVDFQIVHVSTGQPTSDGMAQFVQENALCGEFERHVRTHALNQPARGKSRQA